MTNLQQKLEQYNFPEPKVLKERSNNGYPAYAIFQIATGVIAVVRQGICTQFFIENEDVPNLGCNWCCLATELNSDTDWESASELIKFWQKKSGDKIINNLKGEK